MLFWTDEVPNYEVYRTLCGLGDAPEEPFCRDSFEQYRKNYNLTEREFESIRRQESEISCIMLLLYQEILKH